MGKSKELAELGQVVTQDGGNVGIGSNPIASSKVLVTHSGSTFDAVRVNSDTVTDNTGIYLRTTGTAGISFGSTSSLAFFGGGAGLTERMRIDASGRVTMPYQPHIFGTPGVGSSNTSGTASIFTTKSSYGLSFSNSRITVPVAGVYMITFTTITGAGSGRVDTKIAINNAYRIAGLNNQSDNGGSADYRHRSMSATVKLAANDFIQFTSDYWYANGTAYDEWQTASVTLLG